MRTRLDYETASYGTGFNVASYSFTVRIVNRAEILIAISPASPAEGRGVGPSRGSVTCHETTIPCDVARQLGAVLILAAEMNDEHFEASFKVDESSQDLSLKKSA